MFVRDADYEVKCMLCGTEVGQVVNGALKQHDGCNTPMPRKGGMARCCHCGGSLYFDRIDVQTSVFERGQIARVFADEVA
jgi:hypothetical protein